VSADDELHRPLWPPEEKIWREQFEACDFWDDLGVRGSALFDPAAQQLILATFGLEEAPAGVRDGSGYFF
jgi:hypothetical protein